MNRAIIQRLQKMKAEAEDSIDRFDGDEEFYFDFLEQFLDNENILELRKAVDAGDSKKAEAEVHTLKGLALNLGLLPLADVCMDMLLDLRAGQIDAAMAQIDAVEKEFKKWADVIREYQD